MSTIIKREVRLNDRVIKVAIWGLETVDPAIQDAVIHQFVQQEVKHQSQRIYGAGQLTVIDAENYRYTADDPEHEKRWGEEIKKGPDSYQTFMNIAAPPELLDALCT